MGQYYLLVNIDKAQKMSPFAAIKFDRGPGPGVHIAMSMTSPFMTGMKMYEQLYNVGMKPLLFIAMLPPVKAGEKNSCILRSRWAGNRVLFIGDYSKSIPHINESDSGTFGSSLYNHADDEFLELATKPGRWLEKLDPTTIPDNLSYVNDDLQEYISSSTLTESDLTWTIPIEHGEPLLIKGKKLTDMLCTFLFHSDGNGGGDIPELRSGRWAGNRIRLSTDIDKSYRDVSSLALNNLELLGQN